MMICKQFHFQGCCSYWKIVLLFKLRRYPEERRAFVYGQVAGSISQDCNSPVYSCIITSSRNASFLWKCLDHRSSSTERWCV